MPGFCKCAALDERQVLRDELSHIGFDTPSDIAAEVTGQTSVGQLPADPQSRFNRELAEISADLDNPPAPRARRSLRPSKARRAARRLELQMTKLAAAQQDDMDAELDAAFADTPPDPTVRRLVRAGYQLVNA